MFAGEFRDRRIDLLGVTIIGTATGLGGGVLRDLLLQTPLVALHTDAYLIVAVTASLLGMLLQHLLNRVDGTITALDALTLGLFGAIGTTKALSLGVPEVPAVFVGTVSAVGGSVVRDILLNRPIALMHVGSLYAVAASAGTVVLVVTLRFGVTIGFAATLSVAVTAVIRLLAVRYGWSLPEQRALRGVPRLRWRRRT
ncbi:TRIC cation channel family protein [Rathayibacter agropyri]|nr:TRIC cation channel family protein [Rathayibacter agropyri]